MVILASLAAIAALAIPSSGPMKVELKFENGAWRLRRAGQPYHIRGAGGDHELVALKACGGNSTRTWGAEEIPGRLAEADRLGMTVTAGIWLGHKRHGFDYANEKSVREQYEKVRETVLAHRNHPALLFWALGNEMEVGNDTPELWKAIGELARLAKTLDPNHPVMTVVADLTPAKIKNIQTYAPEIDVLGLNSYGGLASLPKRLKEAGWTKPYVITEFGPLGPWESGRTDWGAAFEATSTEKAKFYASNYDAAISGQPGRCLGSYAFLWGHKQETTPTWFGLFLPTGEGTGPLDELVLRWTGKLPPNRSPGIREVVCEANGKRLAAGKQVELQVEAYDPEGDPLKYVIEVRHEVTAERPMGEGEKGPEVLPKYPRAFADGKTTFEVPPMAGPYRLYIYVFDGKGRAATANFPFFSTGSA